MNTFFVKSYNATGASSPTSDSSFATLVNTYKVGNKLESYGYSQSSTISLVDFVHTGTSCLAEVTGDIYAPSYGLYEVNILVSGCVVQVWIEDTLIIASYINNSAYLVKLLGGPQKYTIYIFGAGSSSSVTLRWKAASDPVFREVEREYLPIYGLSLFPFTLYDEINEDVNKDYIILGEDFQKQDVTDPHKPYRKFSIILKQDNVYDRLLLWQWFRAVMGKYKAFLFSTHKCEIQIVEDAGVTTNQLKIKSSSFTESLSILKRVLHIPSKGIWAQVISSVGVFDRTLGPCELLSLDVQFSVPIEMGTAVEFLYVCRLDTDVMAFELYDLDYSTVNLPLIELYDDNNLVYLK